MPSSLQLQIDSFCQICIFFLQQKFFNSGLTNPTTLCIAFKKFLTKKMYVKIIITSSNGLNSFAQLNLASLDEYK